ncbi:MAG: glycine zipper 2TM domain-containing protein [Pseudomonadota bacterium]|nr:glycine zipper 2TM domain-containing protein [Pseudomonadota bacterium]
MKAFALVPLLATAAFAAQAQPYLDNARVTGVEPQVESFRAPRQECQNQWISEPRRGERRNYGGAVLGGVAGGLIGNRVGRGHGREAATAIGAVFGALTGDNLANRDRWDRDDEGSREVTTCRTVDDVQTRTVGYRVTYEYRGQQFTTLLHENPGPYLPVRVSVEPVGR